MKNANTVQKKRDEQTAYDNRNLIKFINTKRHTDSPRRGMSQRETTQQMWSVSERDVIK